MLFVVHAYEMLLGHPGIGIRSKKRNHEDQNMDVGITCMEVMKLNYGSGHPEPEDMVLETGDRLNLRCLIPERRM